ncbi:DUF2165 family protein [Aestuariivirga sp.]|uniref:DUF2165 family protein n=1 Tax=Aestuariivirga sp. TaxID=2650926 RepID=UPI0039E53157
MIVRLCKIAMVAAIAFFASLVAFGNITDYGTNLAFVNHVLLMDTIFPDSAIKYRAITSPALHQAFYILIIVSETLTAILCWIGAFRMLSNVSRPAAAFNLSKHWAIAGLTFGFLLWQVAFQSMGGEWFGMWQSQSWNGEDSAFRDFITILGVLIFVAMPDAD